MRWCIYAYILLLYYIVFCVLLCSEKRRTIGGNTTREFIILLFIIVLSYCGHSCIIYSALLHILFCSHVILLIFFLSQNDNISHTHAGRYRRIIIYTMSKCIIRKLHNVLWCKYNYTYAFTICTINSAPRNKCGFVLYLSI